MVDFEYKERYSYADLLRIMELLRGPGGCPWDAEQTHESIRRDLIEETCEAAEAIDKGDLTGLCEELGDMLLQVVFHARIEEERGGFTMEDVVDGVCKKLVYRHPHVFGEVQVAGSGEVLVNWDVLKRAEKGQETAADAVDAVARTLPALWRAEKIHKKAVKAGFTWPTDEGRLNKLAEETEELRRAVESGRVDGPHGVREEVGDVLLAAALIAQQAGVDPEAALHEACDKFSARFRKTEELAGGSFKDLPIDKLTELWKRSGRES